MSNLTPSAVAQGSLVAISVTVTSGSAASGMLVDLEIFNQAGQKVGQTFFSAQTFSAGQSRAYSWNYSVGSSLTTGSYRIAVGVFNSDWTQNPFWTNSVGSFSVYSPAAAPATLREAAARAGKFIGAAAVYPQTEGASGMAYPDTLRTEFNMLVADWQFKFNVLQPSAGSFDFTAADKLMDFAVANGMKVRGHALAWHEALPSWLTSGTYSGTQKAAILQNHIQTVVAHFRDKYPNAIYGWDVVNEAVDDMAGLRTSFWSSIGSAPDDYVKLAFQTARQTDPNIKLFYNDYGGEAYTGSGSKAARILSYLSAWKAAGTPIDGAGLQTHVGYQQYLNPAEVTDSMNRLGALGLEVHVTELDVSLTAATAAQLADQADTYWRLADVCVTNANCKALVTWGFTDAYSWIPWFNPAWGFALPWDANYAKKPAYDSLLKSFSGIRAPAFAAPGKLEAEYFSTKTVGVPDGSAWLLWANGSMSQSVSFASSGTYVFSIEAKGSPAAGVWPIVEVRVDGVAVGQAVVNSSAYAVFSVSATVPSGSRVVELAFVNDATVGAEDRNVWIDRLRMTTP